MRLPVDRIRSSLAPVAALSLLAGCMSGADSPAPLASAPPSGPAADYPMVLGEAFTIGSVTYTPEDKLNYDAVGLAQIGDGNGSGDGSGNGSGAAVSGAHKTLPLPSYVEVTALDSGRTTLVRLTERGPMSNDFLIGLSAGAAGQLGLAPGAPAPVRVRRVNPGEQERALLRTGGQAPARMETPQALLKVLRRKLAEQTAPGMAGVLLATAVPATAAAPIEPGAAPSDTPPAAPPAPAVAAAAAPAESPPQPKPVAAEYDLRSDKFAGEAAPAAPLAEPAPPAKSAPPAEAKSPAMKAVVQAATFSTQERADAAAKAIGGFVTKSGKFWHLRLGPYASTADAKAGLEKARLRGYRDARIMRSD